MKPDAIIVTWLGTLAAIATTAAITLGVWWWDRAPVVDYGANREAHFVPDRAKAGQFIELCFAEINWHRAECPGQYYWSWLTSQGELKTPQPHKISNPPKAVRLKNKCRAFQVPTYATPGLNYMVETYAANKCSAWHEWRPLIAPGPDRVPLMIEP